MYYSMIRALLFSLPSTRFAGISWRAAALILAIAGALTALGLWISATPAPADDPPSAQQQAGDLALYRQIVSEMRKGARYEEAAVSEHRSRHYPVQPFVTVRPPLLANFLARLPSESAGAAVLASLGVLSFCAWAFRLLREPGAIVKTYIFFALLSGSISAFASNLSLFHEAWAGQLISLSLALRSERRFTASALLGLLAALIRELALPYLLAMALAAFWEKRWREGTAFALAIGIVLVGLAVHAHSVHQLTGPDDVSSPGWFALGGWSFVLLTSGWNMLTVTSPAWVAAIFVPLSLLGALALKGAAGLRLFLLLGGYTLAFTVVGRPCNFYWGLLIAPLLGVGLAMAPAALWQLGRSLMGRAPEPAASQALNR
jgi:hypothetical protein